MTEAGFKDDAGKTLAGTLADFAMALEQVAEVASFGARKYTRTGWVSVPNARERYYDAMWRHLLASAHEPTDPESGHPHLAHVAWNILAVLELDKRGAAPASTNDGWIEWKGGECPVADGAEFEVRFRNGEQHSSKDYPGFAWRWKHFGTKYDIVAYRVIK